MTPINTVHVLIGTTTVGLIIGVGAAVLTAFTPGLTPVLPLGLTIAGEVIISTPGLRGISTPIAPVASLFVLPPALVVLLFLRTVAVGLGSSCITLLLTLMGRFLLIA